MDTPTKVCTKCGREKPATPEYFSRDVDKKDGLRPSCRACRCALTPPKQLSFLLQCRACGKDKTLSEMQPSEKNRRGVTRNCKECHKIITRKWKDAHPEQANAAVKRWHKEHPKITIAHRNAYRERNREELNRKSREKARNNPEPQKARTRTYRAKKHAGGRHTAQDVQLQYETQEGKCYWCGCDVFNKYHVDHVIPVSRGGSNNPDNIVIAYPPCNLSKNDKLPHEWAGNKRDANQQYQDTSEDG